jgi:hypothetical protein
MRPGPGRPPIAGVEPADMAPGDASAAERGEPTGGLAGNKYPAGVPSIAVLSEARWGARAGLRATGEASLGAVGQVPALRRARRAR